MPWDDDAAGLDAMWGPLPSHVIPYAERDPARDQPWLTPEMLAQAEAFEARFSEPDIERIRDDLGPEVAEFVAGFADQFGTNRRRAPTMRQYILTPDFRIVEERNSLLWSMFTELGKHRVIDRTTVRTGPPPNRNELELFGPPPSWRAQQRRKRSQKWSDEIDHRRQEVEVSTVFVGVAREDLFETMIFGGMLDGMQWRHDRMDEAKAAHWDAVHIAQEHCGFMRRHGRHVKKLYRRKDQITRLARMRGEQWCKKHFEGTAKLLKEIDRIPGRPCWMPGDTLFGMAERILSRGQLRRGREKLE